MYQAIASFPFHTDNHLFDLFRSWRRCSQVGVTVSIAGKTAVTDCRGSLKIEKIPAGPYTLTITKAGYWASTITGFVINKNLEGLVFPIKHD